MILNVLNMNYTFCNVLIYFQSCRDVWPLVQLLFCKAHETKASELHESMDEMRINMARAVSGKINGGRLTSHKAAHLSKNQVCIKVL